MAERKKGTHRQTEAALKNLNNVGRKLTPEERSASARKAGIASGVSRRRRREMRTIIDEYLSMPVKSKPNFDDLTEAEAFDQAKKMNLTVGDILVMEQIKKALRGDTRAFETIRDTSGQKAAEKQEINVSSPLDKLTEQLSKMAEDSDVNAYDDDDDVNE